MQFNYSKKVVSYLRRYYARALNFSQRVFHISLECIFKIARDEPERWFNFKKCMRHLSYLLKTRGEPQNITQCRNLVADINWIMFLRYGVHSEKYSESDKKRAIKLREEGKYWGWDVSYKHFFISLYEEEESMFFQYHKDGHPSSTQGKTEVKPRKEVLDKTSSQEYNQPDFPGWPK